MYFVIYPYLIVERKVKYWKLQVSETTNILCSKNRNVKNLVMAGWQLSSKCKQFLLPPSVEEVEALAACPVAQFALEIRLDSGFELREQNLYISLWHRYPGYGF